MQLSKLAKIIEPTIARKLFMLAREYDDVINFTIGDPDIPTPTGIVDAAYEAIKNGRTHYSANLGIDQLRRAIAENIKKEHDCSYSDDEIIITIGAMEALYLSLMATVDSGDEVIIFAPYWKNYENMVRLCGGKAVIVKSCQKYGFIPQIKDVENAITDKTRVIIINSPNNPTGVIYEKSFLFRIIELAKEKSIIIISDEVYRSIIFTDEAPSSIIEFPDIKKNAILINSMSKAFAMTGWRVGYAAGDKEVIKAMMVFQQNMANCAPTPSQYAAFEAVSHLKKYSNEVCTVFRKRRDVFMEEINKISKLSIQKCNATFYSFIDVSETGMDGERFAYELLEKEHVAVIPGIAFGKGYENYVRIAFTLDEEKIRIGINRLAEFIDKECETR